ncbi:MAG TPA: hypothetical protein VHB27_22055 [Rhodopila sp.]|uniref:hypothetical protein n=1 Tax=Rhodopila sp. TaxID=2480087 RepID=UPI002CC5D5B4|nr:hypothetical protein [Rhodopila sp.]HVY17918.1 hypothetical protein [Rhodopila sp.]
MRAARLALLLFLPLAACATLPGTASTPYLPASVFGIYEDNDIGAINYAAWAFASPANTRGNPLAAMRAVIALEYLPGELTESPRWIGMDGSIKLRLAQARDEVRQILGIQPNVPPQVVVNALLWASNALQAGDQPAALHALAAPGFTLPPPVMLERLSNLPYVQDANLATSRAQAQSFPPTDNTP